MGCHEVLRPGSPFVEEAVQEALMRAWNWMSLHPGAATDRPRSWFHRTGVRAALDLLRRETRSRAVTGNLRDKLSE
ncbi:MAG: sigma factor [Planctomycetota bacterium]